MKAITITYREESSRRERAMMWLLDKVVSVHAKVYRTRPVWGLKREDMLRYPAGSLGHELGLFLTRENLQPVDRIERHDAFHILLGFNTTMDDEAAMLCFLVGNGKNSPFTLAATLLMVLAMPDKWHLFLPAYQRGHQARCIARWNFLDLLDEPFADVKAAVFRQPVHNARLLHKISQ